MEEKTMTPEQREMELIFGDTSDEACKKLHSIAESLHNHGAM